MKQAADAIDSRGLGQDIANAGLFFRRWLANPVQMGAMLPSGRALCRAVVMQVRCAPDEIVLELGAGTGVVSHALRQSGLPPERLHVVEIVHDMATHLRQSLPGTRVIEGDAWELPSLIPQQWHGRIGTVIVGIPLVLMPLHQQRRFIQAVETVAPGRGFICYTYWISSPLPHDKLGLTARQEAWTLSNFPPASVWRYTPR